MRGITLLVSENGASRELMEEIAAMVDRHDPRIDKISKVAKESKNRDRYPTLILANNQIINDINKIYFFILSDDVKKPRYDMPARKGDIDYEEYINDSFDYDDDGKPIVNEDDHEDISDDDNVQVDTNRTVEEFHARRSKIQVPKLRHGKPKVDRLPRPKKQKQKQRQKSKPKPRDDSYEEQSGDSFDERYPDGDNDLDDYMKSEALDTRR